MLHKNSATPKAFAKGINNTPYSYEVTEIELIEDSTTDVSSSPLNRSTNSISAAKILKGVEKSYDKGKKLLDESKKLVSVPFITALLLISTFSSADDTDEYFPLKTKKKALNYL